MVAAFTGDIGITRQGQRQPVGTGEWGQRLTFVVRSFELL